MDAERQHWKKHTVSCPHHILLCWCLLYKDKVRLQRWHSGKQNPVKWISSLRKMSRPPDLILLHWACWVLRLLQFPRDLKLPCPRARSNATRWASCHWIGWNLGRYFLHAPSKLLSCSMHLVESLCAKVPRVFVLIVKLVGVQQQHQPLPRPVYSILIC